MDLFIFNHDATKIKEVQGEPAPAFTSAVHAGYGRRQVCIMLTSNVRNSAPAAVYRSNWLGGQGHEERKKQAEASARAAAQRGQLP